LELKKTPAEKATTYFSYSVDWYPCYQFERNPGECYFKNLKEVYNTHNKQK